MIACDNPKCPIEWYHYKCLNLHSTPKGEWFCDQCKSQRKKKHGNKTTRKHKVSSSL